MAKSSQPGAARKKAVVLMSDGALLPGYIVPVGLGRCDSLDLLTENGGHAEISLGSVRSIFFVNDLARPVALARKSFLSRPKLQGLWIRLIFRDGETLEGVVPNDINSLLEDGVQISPPDLSGNCQRIFVPRSALAGATVLGVVGTDVTRRRAARPKPAPAPSTQRQLFPDS